MTKPGLLMILASALLAGCGSDDDGAASGGTTGGQGVESCQLQVTLSGAVAETLDWDSMEGCGGGGTPDVLNLGWGLVTATNVKLAISGATEGQTSTGLRARVTITNEDRVWSTADDACQVDLAKFELREETSAGKSYRIGGTGSCATPADVVDSGATGAVTIGDLVFASTALY